MKQNSTSAAVEDFAALCSRNGGTQNGQERIADDEFLAIAEKYLAMEDALTKIRDAHGENCKSPETYDVFFQADAALDFDPLSSSPNSL